MLLLSKYAMQSKCKHQTIRKVRMTVTCAYTFVWFDAQFSCKFTKHFVWLLVSTMVVAVYALCADIEIAIQMQMQSRSIHSASCFSCSYLDLKQLLAYFGLAPFCVRIYYYSSGSICMAYEQHSAFFPGFGDESRFVSFISGDIVCSVRFCLMQSFVCIAFMMHDILNIMSGMIVTFVDRY